MANLKNAAKKEVLSIDGKSLTLKQIRAVAQDTERTISVELSAVARKKMQQSRDFIVSKLKEPEPIYGVNTGFGLMSKVRVGKEKLKQLQVNLLRSHAVGIGVPLSAPEVRAAILLRANTLAYGCSGVRPELVDALLKLLNKGVLPWIPGSVGACGDLAPLAHLALVLIGEGKAYWAGHLVSGSQALAEAGIKPISLEPKEGLSLINGTQIMTAIGVLAFLRAEDLCEMADVAGAMSVEALQGSVTPFDAEIQSVRPHPGQIKVATRMRKLLSDSQIMAAHVNCEKVQDPYSLRCIPQVHGIAREVIQKTRKILEIEVNSVTDNPMVFVKGSKGRILNGGNFHGEYVAITMDEMAIAVAELANISEQRIEKLINPSFSDLPAFLIKDGGLNSGFMIVQVAAASLVSENKVLCHPASVDSIPTSADKEDHVSMGTIAARKARQVVDNAWNVIAMEFLAASQGIDFRKPLRPARLVERAHRAIREVVAPIDQDRAFYEDIEAVSNVMKQRKLVL